MIQTDQPYRAGSFVLRIWWEPNGQDVSWRGWVQHAASGDARYIQDVADLLAFVQAHTGPLAHPDQTRDAPAAR